MTEAAELARIHFNPNANLSMDFSIPKCFVPKSSDRIFSTKDRKSGQFFSAGFFKEELLVNAFLKTFEDSNFETHSTAPFVTQVVSRWQDSSSRSKVLIIEREKVDTTHIGPNSVFDAGAAIHLSSELAVVLRAGGQQPFAKSVFDWHKILVDAVKSALKTATFPDL